MPGLVLSERAAHRHVRGPASLVSLIRRTDLLRLHRPLARLPVTACRRAAVFRSQQSKAAKRARQAEQNLRAHRLNLIRDLERVVAELDKAGRKQLPCDQQAA